MKLLRLGLKTRIYCGFGALVLLGVALAGFGVWELSGIGFNVERMGVLSDNTARITEAESKIQIIRRVSLRYTIDQNEDQLKEAVMAEAEAIERLQAAAAATTVHPPSAASVSTFSASISRARRTLSTEPLMKL